MALHKYYCKSSTYKFYIFIRANGGFENFQYEILETNIPKDEEIYKERYYYDIHQPNLNNNVPGTNTGPIKVAI